MDKSTLVEADIFSDQIVAFHGTSVKRLLGYFEQEKFPVKAYLAPVIDRLETCLSEEERPRLNEYPFTALTEEGLHSVKGAFKHAQDYALAWAIYDYIHERTGLSNVLDNILGQEDHPVNFSPNGINGFWRDTMMEEALVQGHEYEWTQQQINIACNRKGVIVGIERKFFTGKSLGDFQLNETDIAYPKDDDDCERIPLSGISALYFINNTEKNEFVMSRKN